MNYLKLIELTHEQIEEVRQYSFERTCITNQLEPPNKNLVLIKGLRGIGKTTSILQYLGEQQNKGKKVLYISADSTLIEGERLINIAGEFKTRGGGYLAIDEIHKYPDWQKEVLDIVNFHSNTKLLVSGSSSLNLEHKSADLSRRHISIETHGLSFREWIEFVYSLQLKEYTLEEILTKPEDISYEINTPFKSHELSIIEQFHKYLQEGYFPTRPNYQSVDKYYLSLKNSINAIIDQDIPSRYTDINESTKNNLKRLLGIISQQCPFIPTITKLRSALQIQDDNTLKKYLLMLDQAKVLNNIYQANRSYKDFPRPEKIYLENTNFMYALSQNIDIGNIRETYAVNALKQKHNVSTPKRGDILVDTKFTFEIGGKGKTRKQIKEIQNSFVLNDNIDYAHNNHLPLWILGCLKTT